MATNFEFALQHKSDYLELSNEISKLRNAYLLKPEKEYNVGKSVRHLEQVKMYADLARI